MFISADLQMMRRKKPVNNLVSYLVESLIQFRVFAMDNFSVMNKLYN